MLQVISALRAAFRFRDYKPQQVTFRRIRAWIKQFDKRDQKSAAQLLGKILYFSEHETLKSLVSRNDALMRKLKNAGIPTKNMIYVQVHDAGSSSPLMLNILRDTAGLERLGCNFVDSRDSLKLNELTNRLEEGAIIYVDDFVGTGNQFCGSRDFAMQSVVGNFAEFLLVPCICEEALYQLGAKGIEAVAGYVHSKAERPLHEYSTLFDAETKMRLRDLCQGIDRRAPLGYKDLATMVVLYRNAPNTIPAIFRGSLNQTPFAGVFPRTTDLPKRNI